MTDDVEARLKAAYAPLHPDPARADDLARALDDATQAPPTRVALRALPWAVACAATLVGAFLLVRRTGPSGPVERPAHDGPAVTAFVDARGRTTLAGVDGRALRTWELGELPVDLATPADIGKLVATEVAPFAPPVDAGQVPRLPDIPVVGPLFRRRVPVALVVDAAADVPWRHVESVLIAAAQARLADVVFLDPSRAGPPVRNRLPVDAGPVYTQLMEVDPGARLEIRLRPAADGGGPSLELTSSAKETLVVDVLGLATLTGRVRDVAAAYGTAEVTVEVFPLPPDPAERVTYGHVFAVLRAVEAGGEARVLFAAGAGRRGK